MPAEPAWVKECNGIIIIHYSKVGPELHIGFRKASLARLAVEVEKRRFRQLELEPSLDGVNLIFEPKFTLGMTFILFNSRLLWQFALYFVGLLYKT